MTSILSAGVPGSTAPVLVRNPGFNWSAVIAGALVAAATSFFLITLGAGFGLVLTSRTGTFFTLGAIWVLAAQAFGFAAGGHVAGRLIGPAAETTREEEIRAGAHGLVVWAIAVAVGVLLLALVATGGARGLAAMHRDNGSEESGVAAYWTDILLRPDGPHSLARGEDLNQDKAEAARILAADLHPNAPAHNENHADLVRLTAMDAGLSEGEAIDRVNSVEGQMRQELDNARKAAGYAGLWLGLALLFGAVLSVAAAISARWEDDKIHFHLTRRYY